MEISNHFAYLSMKRKGYTDLCMNWNSEEEMHCPPDDGVSECYDLYLNKVLLIHLITVGDSELNHRLLALTRSIHCIHKLRR